MRILGRVSQALVGFTLVVLARVLLTDGFWSSFKGHFTLNRQRVST